MKKRSPTLDTLPHPTSFTVARLILVCAALCPTPRSFAAIADGEIAAVSSRASEDYIRTKLPDGTFKPEAYAFGPGGHSTGVSPDPTIDQARFLDIARTLAGPLADQNYLPARDPAKTQLLIMVYWGTSAGSRDSQNTLTPRTLDEKMMFKALINSTDTRNARMLGYDAAGIIGTDYGRNLLGTAFRHRTEDLLEEIGDNRYFVVLMAYDFQLLWKQKKTKLLWETRFSLRQRHNDFAEALPAMAQDASRYFGQATRGLIRKPLRAANVELGELKNLGEASVQK